MAGQKENFSDAQMAVNSTSEEWDVQPGPSKTYAFQRGNYTQAGRPGQKRGASPGDSEPAHKKKPPNNQEVPRRNNVLPTNPAAAAASPGDSEPRHHTEELQLPDERIEAGYLLADCGKALKQCKQDFLRKVEQLNAELNIFWCGWFHGTIAKSDLLSFQEDVKKLLSHYSGRPYLPGEREGLNQVGAGVQHTPIAQDTPLNAPASETSQEPVDGYTSEAEEEPGTPQDTASELPSSPASAVSGGPSEAEEEPGTPQDTASELPASPASLVSDGSSEAEEEPGNPQDTASELPASPASVVSDGSSEAEEEPGNPQDTASELPGLPASAVSDGSSEAEEEPGNPQDTASELSNSLASGVSDDLSEAEQESYIQEETDSEFYNSPCSDGSFEAWERGDLLQGFGVAQSSGCRGLAPPS